jgi:hypothetical protein
MFCKFCGKQITDGVTFCNFCGNAQTPVQMRKTHWGLWALLSIALVGRRSSGLVQRKQ